MISIKDKVIVVTGGNGLLGKQMITIFRNNGALAISVDINFSYNIPFINEKTLAYRIAQFPDIAWPAVCLK